MLLLLLLLLLLQTPDLENHFVKLTKALGSHYSNPFHVPSLIKGRLHKTCTTLQAAQTLGLAPKVISTPQPCPAPSLCWETRALPCSTPLLLSSGLCAQLEPDTDS